MTEQNLNGNSLSLSENDQVRIVEALLFASPDPLDKKTLSEKLPENTNIDEIINKIEDMYQNRGFELKKIGNKFMFKTSGDLSFIMQREAKAQRKLSKAAIETLAIIAYHQPVTRAEIEDIRGVTVSSGTIDTLLQMNWVKIKGRRKVPGNPIAYGTTEEFLVHFDLQSIKDLPDMQELKSMGLLDNNLPPDLYPENLLNNDDIEEIDDINSNKVDGEF
ncbi:MAG: SMC-Scp complex subunit ScpB [Pseudomonadota bacterium]|jgi:segregation and condensation protein B|nr:SMC-Scp complex subunit ScpB [Pseudomonadota bacterium]MEC9098096.1 SMC-Scp complex subunit ScpB [Pseudomonadota bacterium]MED5272898.1 SMC-Scp complex subunit ScpB [Pseudomonadota bacterium]|tara:strand:+ start:844 stop:1500 length:657 start_codon:yes stop_codon:yes gene_type:complete